MRLSNIQAVARPVYYDRNPTPKALSYSAGGVAPHAATQRWTYTVPAGRKAFIEIALAYADRQTVATGVGAMAAFVNYTPNGGGLAELGRAAFIDNTVGARSISTIGAAGYMGAGDIFSASTVDTSTGGTFEYSVGAKLSEFDV